MSKRLGTSEDDYGQHDPATREGVGKRRKTEGGKVNSIVNSAMSPDEKSTTSASLGQLNSPDKQTSLVAGQHLDIHDIALKLHMNALGDAPEDNSDLSYRQASLAASHTDKFKRFGNIQDLEAAHALNKGALRSALAGHPDFAARQLSLAVTHTYQFKWLGNTDELTAALRLCTNALDSTPAGHPDLGTRQAALAISYADQYEQYGNKEDLKAGLALCIKALDNTPPGHPDLGARQESLAKSYANHFRELGNMEDIKMALVMGRCALDNTPTNHPDYPARHVSLAKFYYLHFHRLGNMEDLETSIAFCICALDNTPEDHPDYPARQEILGLTYVARFTELGNIKDSEAALPLLTSALNNTPAGHTDLPTRQTALGAYYFSRFKHLGDLKDLETCFALQFSALEGTPTSHPKYLTTQGNLASCYMARFRYLGNMEDLEADLVLEKSILDSTPDDHHSLQGRQRALSHSYIERFRHLGNVKDLEASFALNKSVLDSTPMDSRLLSERQTSLAIDYRNRFDLLGNIYDLEAAIELLKTAIDSTPAGHTSLPNKQVLLSTCYTARFKKYGAVEDSDASLVLEQSALDNTPTDHADLPARYSSLSVSYTTRFSRLHNIEDLETALALCKKTLDAIPPDHHKVSYVQSMLAISYIDYYIVTKDESHLLSAANLLSTFVQSPVGSAKHNYDAAISMARWAKLCAIDDCVKAYAIAFASLPDLLWMGNPVSLRQKSISKYDIPYLSSSAVSAAIHFNKLEMAAQFFDQGLSLMHKQALELRSYDDMLEQKYPSEASQLRQLSSKLMRSESGDSAWKAASDYNVTIVKRKKLIQHIQQLPGFENFLLPASYASLSRCAQNGPVIMINTLPESIDVLIILSPERLPLHISLPISAPQIKKYLNTLKAALHRCLVNPRQLEVDRGGRPAYQHSSQEMFQKVLSWLWQDLVLPVFDVLYKNGKNNGRIWWCPSGDFTYLPIHAAAPTDSPYIQSYTTTLDALSHAYSQQHSVWSSTSSELMTAVGISHIPGKSDKNLPNVQKELETIAAACAQSTIQITTLLNHVATVDNVLKHIKVSSWLHLACHGQQVKQDALQSHMLLYNGQLTLGQILNAAFSGVSKFVFLSACQTATGDETIINESMHLAGGFIAAGFQGAIGTLWNMADSDGPKIAKIVYEHMFSKHSISDTPHTPDPTLAAEGLHLAIQQLRKEGAPPQQWMPYIHFGI